MKKISLLMLALLGAMGVKGQQLPNSDFNGNWVDCVPWASNNNTTKYGIQPEGWVISNVPNSMVGLVGPEDRPNSNDGVTLTNQSTMGEGVPAYLTLGTPWATAEVKSIPTAVRNADGGTWGGVDFRFHPDAVKFNYKRNNSKGAESASAIAYVWSGEWSQANVPGNTAVGFINFGSATKITMKNRDRNILGMDTSQGGAITKSGNAALIGKGESYYADHKEEWTVGVIDIDYGIYTNTDVEVEKLNIIFSANNYFGEKSDIVSGNSLTVKNIELVYYHALKDLAYQGQSILFDENIYSYDLSDVEYDNSKISYIKKGQGAAVSTHYNYETGILVIRVQAEDYDADTNNAAYTEYSIQFKVVDTPTVRTTTNYSNSLMVGVNGVVTPPQVQEITVTEYIDGTYDFTLNNFMLGSGESIIPVGNIKLARITAAVTGGIISLEAKQTITISAGEPANAGWMGPMLGNVPVELVATIKEGQLVCNIDINMLSSLGQIIEVVFAPGLSLSEETGYDGSKSNLHCVSLTRSLREDHWNTVCFPFAMNAAQIAANFGDNAEVVEFTSAVDGELNFTTANSIEAGVPYLLKIGDEENDEYEYTGTIYIAAELSPASSVTQDGYTFQGSYTNGFVPTNAYFISNSMFYKAVTGTDTMKGFRAYVTEQVSSQSKALSVSIDGATTSIEEVEGLTNEVSGDIYTPAGLLVRKNARSLEGLGKGIYIVKGKKVVIK